MADFKESTTRFKNKQANSNRSKLSWSWMWRTLIATVILLCFNHRSTLLFHAFNQLKYLTGLEYTICSNSKNIYTVDKSKPRVECISVYGSKIMDTGSSDEIENRILEKKSKFIPSQVLKFLHRRNLRYIDLGSIIVPGLSDAHGHVLEYGSMKQLPLTTTTSIAEIIQLVKLYIRTHPDVRDDENQWIEGMGWDQTKWPGAQFPTFADFNSDPDLRNRPICLTRVDGHAKWVSQRVLDMMGDLPARVQGGHIIRNSDGSPTGVFIDNAMDLIPAPSRTKERLSNSFDIAMKDALSHGLTSIHDADSRLDHINFFKRKAEAGELPIRLYLMANVPSSDYWGSQISHLHNHGVHGRLNLRSVKLFSDGALGSWGAALLSPYSDKPDTSGILVTPPDLLSNWTLQFWKDGFQVNVHCIGDRANRNVLDIFEKVLHDQDVDVSEWRPRIEHAQIFSLEDLERFGQLGVIASVQPTHATSDMSYAEGRLGPDRIRGAYAYQTLLSLSPQHVLPLGSDFPIESINPLMGFYAAVSRLDHNGSSPHGTGGWFPEQRLTRAQALKGMTLDPAYASFTEDILGSLTPGKNADFVVLDRDIMTIPFDEILGTRVTATIIDGKVSYGRI